MKRNLLLSLLCILLAAAAQAQFTMSSENNTLELSGIVSAYYNQKFYKPTTDNHKDNKFNMRDLELDVKGVTSKSFIYELEVNFYALAASAASGGQISPDNPGLRSGYISYIGWPVKIKIGYDKVPYSQSSLDDVYGTPFWGHSILSGGELFSRRDIGITLSDNFWHKRIELAGGVYSGLGEYIVKYGENDPSGNPEFIGRATVSYPSKMKYDEIDNDGAQTPIFRVGANVRYTNKTQPGSNVIPSDATGAYGIRIVNGERLAYGFDANFFYKYFSAQFEAHMINMRPTSQTDPLFAGTTIDVNHNVVKAGGYIAQLNYNWEKLHSVISARYENVNVNDLQAGHQEWLYVGYAYKVNGFRSAFKVEYYKPLTEDEVSQPLKYTEQVRVGWQLIF